MTVPRIILIVTLFIPNLQSVDEPDFAVDRLDKVIDEAFVLRDINKDGLLSPEEIRQYYDEHPDKMSKKGMSFIDNNFSGHKNLTKNEYRDLVRDWLAENASIHRILKGVFGEEEIRRRKEHHKKLKHVHKVESKNETVAHDTDLITRLFDV